MRSRNLSGADIADQVRSIWDTNAAFWDDHMQSEGNDFHLQLIRPGTERLLELKSGQVVLDLGCGNGLAARRLARLGMHVVACDFSSQMIDHARQRSEGYDIEYLVVDATHTAELLSLGTERFDSIVCNMAIMDMAEIDPLMHAVPKLLKPSGRFVFSICHPCFNTTGISRVVEQKDDGQDVVTTYAVKVQRYCTEAAHLGLGIVGQPRPQYYFDRTLTTLFNACFGAGLVIDGLEEPAFPTPGPEESKLSMAYFQEIPPALIVRARPVLGSGD